MKSDIDRRRATIAPRERPRWLRAPEITPDGGLPVANLDWHPVVGRAAVKRWLNLAVVLSRGAVDALMIVAAFLAAYQLRASIDLFSAFQEPSRATYEIMLAVVVVTLLVTFNLVGLYNLRRGVSRVDQFYRVSAAVSIGLVLSIALNSMLLGNRFIYSRQMLIIGWILCIALVTVGRFVHGEVVGALRKREVARDRLLVIGAGKTGKLVLETIARSPWLGYEIVGVLRHGQNGQAALGEETIGGFPILGDDTQLATLT
ncbi:MAG TPA: hypothetical protein VIL85_18890, partial [Thermomicrobiales bacterium]